ncbi:MAG: hypothetical protein SFW09_18905 [Hyphomicrobiaceae bacterium]|nr:hypothetical protein [Hyphomicrobiaceae bacterium]
MTQIDAMRMLLAGLAAKRAALSLAMPCAEPVISEPIADVAQSAIVAAVDVDAPVAVAAAIDEAPIVTLAEPAVACSVEPAVTAPIEPAAAATAETAVAANVIPFPTAAATAVAPAVEPQASGSTTTVIVAHPSVAGTNRRLHLRIAASVAIAAVIGALQFAKLPAFASIVAVVASL